MHKKTVLTETAKLLRKGLDKRTGEVGGTLEERSEAEFKRMLDPNTDTGQMVAELVEKIVDAASHLTNSDPLANIICKLNGVPVQLFDQIYGPPLTNPDGQGTLRALAAISDEGHPTFEVNRGVVSDKQSLLLLAEMEKGGIAFHYMRPDRGGERSEVEVNPYITDNNVLPSDHRVSPQTIYEHLLSAADAMEKTQRRLAFT